MKHKIVLFSLFCLVFISVYMIPNNYVISNDSKLNDISIITSYNNINGELNKFYNSLPDKDIFLSNTDKFLCNNECVSSSFNNIGLLNESEYNKIGGAHSYLVGADNFFLYSSDNNYKYVGVQGLFTSNDVNTISGIKPTVYSSIHAKVVGSGTLTDPYIFVKGKHKVSVKASDSNGSVLPSGAITVVHGENVSFTLKPNDGYIVKSVTDCPDSVVSNDTITLYNVKQDIKCIINFGLSNS